MSNDSDDLNPLKISQNGDGNIHSKITTDCSSKFRTVLIIIAVIVSAMAMLFVLHEETDSSSAGLIDNGWCGEHTWYQYYSNNILLIEGSGAMYNYNSIDDTPWHEYRDDITKIVIGYEVTSIGDSAFVNLTNLKELSIPITLNSVKSDEHPVFAGCTNIEKIDITYGTDGYGINYAAYPGSNSWYQNTPWYQSRAVLKELNFVGKIIHIGTDSFRELNIPFIVLPDTVTSLGNHCFFNCTKVTELTIPVSLNSYGNEDYPAFLGCTAIQKVTFSPGNGVPFDYTNWWGWGVCNAELAPWNMTDSLKTIIILDNVTSLGKFMFYNTNIKELTIPASAECGSSKAFCEGGFNYSSLEKVTITKGNGRGCDYGYYTYEYNPWNIASNLKTLIVEEGVNYLGNYAFRQCKAETITLPNSLGSLGENVFWESNVKYLTIPISLNAVWLDNYPAFESVTGVEKVTFIPGSGYGFNYAAYKGSNSWYQFTPWYQSRTVLKEIVFDDGVKTIGGDSFRDLYINSIVIPDGVVCLGSHAFFNCYYLTDVTIPITIDSVATAKYPAFEGVPIKVLHLTAGTDGIGFDYSEGYYPPWVNNGATLACNITFDSNIQYIGQNTFYGYTFSVNGEKVEISADYLSGRTFIGENGVMQSVFGTSDAIGPDEMITGCIPSECTDPSSVVKQETLAELNSIMVSMSLESRC